MTQPRGQLSYSLFSFRATERGGLVDEIMHAAAIPPGVRRLGLDIVFIDRTIRARGHQHAVVRRPGHAAHLETALLGGI